MCAPLRHSHRALPCLVLAVARLSHDAGAAAASLGPGRTCVEPGVLAHDASDGQAMAMLQVLAGRGAILDQGAGPSQTRSTRIEGALTLDHFARGANVGCFDRATRSQTAVVDSHLHPRPFGGPPVPFEDLMGWLRRAGVLFANLYGIGQRLPTDSNCTYYLDCPGTPVKPSIKNDFVNAESLLDANASLSTNLGPHVILSISSADLNHPEKIVPRVKLLRSEYPHMFKWVGELNAVKQALFDNNAGFPVTPDEVAGWAPFMKVLAEHQIPIGFHSDLGSDEEPLKYLSVMDTILRTYPNNQIVWLHLGGLSKQLNPRAPTKPSLVEKPLFAPQHVALLRERLLEHANLTIDLAWDVLYDEVFSDPIKRPIYVDLINAFPRRFLTGTDFVAAGVKTEAEYREQLSKCSDVLRDLSDEAFQRIALGQNYFDLVGLDYVAPAVCAGYK
mmetsp:Transcript_109327/g.315982  ORF Transcript_109327/g.315982 Transcript_109327/m.315982 type:complete len:446 (+) Transcript_109327:64-1401(+)